MARDPTTHFPLAKIFPCARLPALQFANDHQEAEQTLLEFSHAMPEMKLAIFRCPPVLGTMAGMGLLREFYFPGLLGAAD